MFANSSISSPSQPVTPGTTISGSVPRRKASTGTPEAAASMATIELVSSTREQMSTAAACRNSRSLRDNEGGGSQLTHSPRLGAI